MNIFKDPMKQMIDFQKNAFNSSFDAMVTMRNQTERMVNTFVATMPMLPESSKKPFSESIQTYKKGCDDYKKAVNQYFDSMEKVFSTEKPSA